MQELYTNYKRVTNQYNNIVLGKNLSQVPQDMRQEFSEKLRIKIISEDLIKIFEKYYHKTLLDYDINHYEMAKYVIKKFQKEKIEILEYTNQLYPLYETCIIKHIDQKIKDFHKFPYDSSYKVIEHTIHKAKESGISVEQYETLLPRLKKEGLLGTLHQKMQLCIVNDSMKNITELNLYIKKLIGLGIFIPHQYIKEELNSTDLGLYTIQEKEGILHNIYKHASKYQNTKDINELDMVLEEIFLAEQLGIEVDLIELAQILGLLIKDQESQEIYVHELLDIFEQYIANPIDKQEKRRLTNLITIFS